MTSKGTKGAETVNSDQNEDNTEAMAREELTRLGRQLRLMENDIVAYTEESQSKISRQIKTISSLQRENEAIENELNESKKKKIMTLKGSVTAADEGTTKNEQEIKNLVEKLIKVESELESETLIVTDVNEKIKSAGKRIEKMKIQMALKNGEVNDLVLPQLSAGEIERKLYTVNKKLEAVTATYDSLVSDNSTLRNSIDQIMRENSSVDKKISELSQKVEGVKCVIDDLMDQATLAYDQREEAVAKSNALLERNEKEKKQFISETSELDRIIQNEEKLLNFMSSKNRDRFFLETDDQRQSRIEQTKEEELDEMIEKYRSSFQKLLTLNVSNKGNHQELENLPEEFSELCKKNISQFNYINELNNEIESLEKEGEDLRSEINKCSFETIERNQAKNAIMILKQSELDELKKQYSGSKNQLDGIIGEIEEIVHFIQRLFQITETDETNVSILELIGKQEEISEQNALLYLNILEERVRELFSTKFEKFEKQDFVSPVLGRKSPRVSTPSMSEQTPNLMQMRPKIVISTTDLTDLTEAFDFGLSPLGYSEMRDKLIESASRPSSPGSRHSDKSPMSRNFPDKPF